jgi:hypothetical protein
MINLLKLLIVGLQASHQVVSLRYCTMHRFELRQQVHASCPKVVEA